MKIFYKLKWIEVEQNDTKLNELSILIGSGVHIESGVYIGSDVYIGSGVHIGCIISKYSCNRYFDIDTKTTYIRIGCETHSIEKWKDENFQKELAKNHNEVAWWNSRGIKILNFLMEE